MNEKLDHFSTNFETAEQAFTALTEQTILRSLVRKYESPMGFFAAIKDAFYEEGEFSKSKTAILAISLIAGGFAGGFYWAPGADGAKALLNIFKQITGIDLPDTVLNIFTPAMQIVGTGENFALTAYSTQEMLNNSDFAARAKVIFGGARDAKTFLNYQDQSKREIIKNWGGKIFDHFTTLASVIPILTLTQNKFLAILSALGAYGPNYMGVSGTSLISKKEHPARRVEIDYLNQQLKEFLYLSFEEQQAILTGLEEIYTDEIIDEETRYKKIYTRLLNLSKPINNPKEAPSSILLNDLSDRFDQLISKIAIQEEPIRSSKKEYAAKGIATMSGIGGFGYVLITGFDIAEQLGKNTSSDPNNPQYQPTPTSITEGVTLALLSLLPFIGLGYNAGKSVGNAMFSDDVSLAKLYFPKLRNALKAFISVINGLLLAGGTNIKVNNEYFPKLFDLIKIAGAFTEYLNIALALIGGASASIVNGYYTFLLIDDLLLYFALRCGNEDVKRLFNFVLETRKLYGVLSSMTEENYLELLAWKMQVNLLSANEVNTISFGQSANSNRPQASILGEETEKRTQAYTDLSQLLHAIFDARLSESEYIKLQRDLNKEHKIVKDKFYTSVPSFFDKEKREWRAKNPGLRHRRCPTLFSSCKRNSNVEKPLLVEENGHGNYGTSLNGK